jgi:hypothetical protein
MKKYNNIFPSLSINDVAKGAAAGYALAAVRPPDDSCCFVPPFFPSFTGNEKSSEFFSNSICLLFARAQMIHVFGKKTVIGRATNRAIKSGFTNRITSMLRIRARSHFCKV